MKYIRTKNGHIYEIDEKGNFVCANERWNLYNRLRQWQLECKQQYAVNTPNGYTTCIKQADTIEELCDEFVVEYENGNMSIFPSYNDLLQYYHSYPQTLHCVKRSLGAIWTDTGLIYVAKMNLNGDLELL